VRTLVQRVQTPVDPPVVLGSVVIDERGDPWMVFSVERPQDEWGGVMIGLAELERS
jgi:hypothetical protein